MTTHVHWYFLSLLVSEIIQAIGQFFDINGQNRHLLTRLWSMYCVDQEGS